MSTYSKKENKFAQTELGKYSFMDKDEGGYTGIAREWTLKRTLEDAEHLIQQEKDRQADIKDELNEMEQKLKKSEMDYRASKREAMNANETNNRLKEQLKDYMHKINLYKIETEELIKQIDLADAKTREKEDELRLTEAEYDRKMKLQEERILFRRGKNEERDTYEIKRKHGIEMEELKMKMNE